MDKKFTYLLLLVFSLSFGQLKIQQEIHPEYPNSNSLFNNIAVSNLDEIYLADKANHEILRINFQGKIINEIGGYGWDENSLNSPADISINSGLNIIVADKNNNRLVRYDKNLNFISQLPDENTFWELFFPKVCEISSEGTIFLLQEDSYEILKLERNSDEYSIIGNNVETEFQLVAPIDIFLTENENLLILEQSGKIIKYDFFGTPIEIVVLSIQNFNAEKILSHKGKILVLSKDHEIYLLQEGKWLQMAQFSGNKVVDFCENGEQIYLLTEKGNVKICQLSQD